MFSGSLLLSSQTRCQLGKGGFQLGFGEGGFDFGDGFVGEEVAAFVAGVASVAFDPLPLHFVLCYGEVKGAPEVGVFDGLFGFGPPAVSFPTGQPTGDAAFQVGGVGEEFDVARFFEGAEGFDGGLKLHAVVGGGRFTTAEFAHVRAVCKGRRPAAGARIAVATAVGVDDDFFHVGSLQKFWNKEIRKEGFGLENCTSRGDECYRIRQVVLK